MSGLDSFLASLDPVLYGKGFTFFSVVILLLSAWGTGGAILHRFFPDQKEKLLSGVMIGLNLEALIFLIVMLIIPSRKTIWILSVFLSLAGGCLLPYAGMPFHWKIRETDPLLLIPAAVCLFFAGYAFVYPAGWDDLVYQLSVVRRWSGSGTLSVYRDLPYSGFPLLPQMLYTPLMYFGGVMAIRLFYIVCLLLFYGSMILYCRRLGRLGRILLPLSILLSPMGTAWFRHSYAELFIALNLLVGLQLSDDIPLQKRGCLAGFFAGAMASVKLSGFLPAGCLFLFLILKGMRRQLHFILPFFLTGAIFSGFFYLRPLLAEGNPFYPYFCHIFAQDSAAMSLYHHALGADKFGFENLWKGLLLSVSTLADPGKMNVFDGSWGWQFLGWAVIVAGMVCFILHVKQRRERLLYVLLPVLLFYGTWYFSSSQTRFLLPVFPLAVCGSILFYRLLPCRYRIVFLCLFGILTFFSIDKSAFNSGFRNLKAVFSGNRAAQIDLLYGRTDEYLTGCEIVHRRKKGERGLLLFEERTLYMPENAEIGTPLFQDRYFRDGDLTAQAVLNEIRLHRPAWILLRIPVYNPDLLPELLKKWPVLEQALISLCKDGVLRASPPLKDGSVLFEVVQDKVIPGD